MSEGSSFLSFLFWTVELFGKILFGVYGPLRQIKLMRDPLMTADIRDAMGATYRQAQEEVAVDRIAQVFGAPAQVWPVLCGTALCVGVAATLCTSLISFHKASQEPRVSLIGLSTR